MAEQKIRVWYDVNESSTDDVTRAYFVNPDVSVTTNNDRIV